MSGRNSKTFQNFRRYLCVFLMRQLGECFWRIAEDWFVSFRLSWYPENVDVGWRQLERLWFQTKRFKLWSWATVLGWSISQVHRWLEGYNVNFQSRVLRETSPHRENTMLPLKRALRLSFGLTAYFTVPSSPVSTESVSVHFSNQYMWVLAYICWHLSEQYLTFQQPLQTIIRWHRCIIAHTQDPQLHTSQGFGVKIGSTRGIDDRTRIWACGLK